MEFQAAIAGVDGMPKVTARDPRPIVILPQSQMWVIDQMTPGNPAYNLPFGYRFARPAGRDGLGKKVLMKLSNDTRG